MLPNEMRAITTLTKRAYDQSMEPVCARHDITRMELDVLLFLANNPGFDTASELVTERGLTKSHVSKAVSSLTERGLLIREYRGGNRKTAHLTLTRASDGIVSEGQAAQRQLQSALLNGFSADEIALMDAFNARFIENLHQITK